MRHSLISILIAIVLLPQVARTQVAQKHSVTIGTDPLQIVLPPGSGNFSAEVLVHADLGIGGTVGVPTKYWPSYYAELYLNFYPFGDFDRGVQLAIQLFHKHLKELTDGGIQAQIAGVQTYWAVGPLVGYKYTFDCGLSMNLQIGVGDVLIDRTLFDNGERGPTRQGTATPLYNLNIGWSF